MKFSDIIGNERAIDMLRGMIDSGNVPHALLIHGEPGIPKLALARATAQYLHCTRRTDGQPCGQCPQCLQHQSLNHADTFFSYPIIKKGENSVSELFSDEWKQFLDECGEVEDFEKWQVMLGNPNSQPMIYVTESDSIIRKMSLAAFSAKYKVLIMWLPEKMNEGCANKLLKMIEEPPADSLFFLVSDNPNLILPTILSRTQRIELQRPSPRSVADFLQKKLGVSRDEAIAAAAPADGNVLQALKNLQQTGESHQFHEMFMQLMRMAYTRNIRELKTWSDEVADFKREKAQRFLFYANRMIRENFIYNLQLPRLNYLTTTEEEFSKNFARFISAKNAEALTKVFDNAAADIKGNANAKIVLFDTALLVARHIR